jgi:fructokinase
MRIGIDLGGTKMEGIALNDNGHIDYRERIDTPHDDYPATVDALCQLIANIEQQAGSSSSIGIGIPGTISPATGLVKNANSTWLIGKPLNKDLEKQLHRPVRIANDANCFAVSEASDGAAAGAEIVFGVIIGTGTGGGICFNGQPLVGANAIGGEWGHNPLPWPQPNELPGPACYCGLHGCIETWLSGTGFANRFQEQTGKALSAPEIVALVEQGDAAAELALQQYEQRMARALASIINVIDPDVIVLGGGMSNVERLYTNVPKLWGEYVFSDRVDTLLVPPKHGDSSGVRGAAWLWPQ